MRIRVEYITEGEEEIVFRLQEKKGVSKEERLQQQEKLLGNLEGEKLLLLPDKILYFEYVEGKVFAYLKEQVLTINLSLEKLEERLGKRGFLRASKSVLLNINTITSFQTMMGNRLIATLSNEEKVVISRHYAKNLRNYLEGGEDHEEI